MQSKLTIALTCALLVTSALLVSASEQSPIEPSREVESAVLAAADGAHLTQQQDESYQRVYDAFTKLMQNMSNNSLGSVRRLVARINKLVGGPSASASSEQDEKTEQILNRLDKVNRDTDQHTIKQLNEDISRLIGTLNESYLRNIRRVVERVNRVVGQPQLSSDSSATKKHQEQHQSPDRLEDPNVRLPGFPGMDELIVAMDRVQKSLAHFVRSSTRLITSG